MGHLTDLIAIDFECLDDKLIEFGLNFSLFLSFCCCKGMKVYFSFGILQVLVCCNGPLLLPKVAPLHQFYHFKAFSLAEES